MNLRYPNFKRSYLSLFSKTVLFVLLIVCCSIHSFSQVTSQKLNLNFKGKHAEEVFKEIEKQSGYHFLYAKEQVEKLGVIDLKVDDASLFATLDLLFSKIKLGYTISEKDIIVKEKKKSNRC